MWGLVISAASAALGAMQQHAAGSAQAAYSKKQAAYNDKMNLKRARTAGVAIDTNTLRARTEAAITLQGIDNQANEAKAMARVQGATLGIGTGSYDTVLNTFAKKQNQAEGATMMGLVSELVANKLQREDVAVQATAGMSTSTQRAPSAFGSILNGAANYFSSTYGLSNAFGSWGSSSDSAGSQSVSNFAFTGQGSSTSAGFGTALATQ